MALPSPDPPDSPSVRRRRTLADLELPERISGSSPHPTPNDTYASSTCLDEIATESSPLSPRLSLRAEMEDRGKPPRGRALSRTPPNELRGRKRRRLTEFTQDRLLAEPLTYVSPSKRWVSVFLVWLAIVGAIVIAVWLRSTSMTDSQNGVEIIDAMDDGDGAPRLGPPSHTAMPMPMSLGGMSVSTRYEEEDGAWRTVPVSHVFKADQPLQTW